MIHEFTSKGIMVSHPFKPGVGVVVIATGEVGYISAIKRPDFAQRFGVTVNKKQVSFFTVEEIRVVEPPVKKRPASSVNKQCKYSRSEAAHIRLMSQRFRSESEYLRYLVATDMEEMIAE